MMGKEFRVGRYSSTTIMVTQHTRGRRLQTSQFNSGFSQTILVTVRSVLIAEGNAADNPFRTSTKSMENSPTICPIWNVSY